jgi:hypothetical protein
VSHSSSAFSLLPRVPLSCILEILLFSSFINGLSAIINHLKFLLFVDGLKIYLDITSVEDCKALQVGQYNSGAVKTGWKSTFRKIRLFL